MEGISVELCSAVISVGWNEPRLRENHHLPLVKRAKTLGVKISVQPVPTREERTGNDRNAREISFKLEREFQLRSLPFSQHPCHSHDYCYNTRGTFHLCPGDIHIHWSHIAHILNQYSCRPGTCLILHCMSHSLVSTQLEGNAHCDQFDILKRITPESKAFKPSDS